jgi:CubicO group peptidase (beta-lactamase class C family)
VLGLVLRAAVRQSLADYLSDRIWRPMGAEADATWLIDNGGQESAYCSVNAVLRDYARCGLLLAHDGQLGDRQIIPKPWVHAATTIPAESWHLKPYAATRTVSSVQWAVAQAAATGRWRRSSARWG